MVDLLDRLGHRLDILVRHDPMDRGKKLHAIGGFESLDQFADRTGPEYRTRGTQAVDGCAIPRPLPICPTAEKAGCIGLPEQTLRPLLYHVLTWVDLQYRPIDNSVPEILE